jgi:intracellular septation protein
MTITPDAPRDLDIVAEAEGSRVHPIVHAGRWIAADLFSTLLFVGLYAVTRSVYLATGLALAVGVAQMTWLKLRGAPIDAMQWVSLALVAIFGGASLITHDPRFIMFKPTLIYAAVGLVMLRWPGWIVRYQPPVALRWSRDVAMRFGYAWAGLMFGTGALNLALMVHGDSELWGWFLGVFPIASKLALGAAQYALTRLIVIRRMRAAGVPRTRAPRAPRGLRRHHQQREMGR